METSPSLKKDWILTPEAFDKLLRQLDADRERAGESYEKIRRKLMKFFVWRGCALAEEYTDKTIDRVARRIDEGTELRASNPYLYFHGFAVNLLREHWKDPEREVEGLDDLLPQQALSQHPEELRLQQEELFSTERRHQCLDECANTLDAESLQMIAEYHQASGGEKIKCRKEMAQRLQIPLNALRIRAHRIRGKLEACIESCIEQSEKA